MTLSTSSTICGGDDRFAQLPGERAGRRGPDRRRAGRFGRGQDKASLQRLVDDRRSDPGRRRGTGTVIGLSSLRELFRGEDVLGAANPVAARPIRKLEASEIVVRIGTAVALGVLAQVA